MASLFSGFQLGLASGDAGRGSEAQVGSHSFNTYLLIASYVLGTVLGFGDTVMGKTDRDSAFTDLSVGSCRRKADHGPCGLAAESAAPRCL